LIKSKIKHIVLIVFILFTSYFTSLAVKIHRICIKGTDVIIIYYPISDTCQNFESVIIYARENPFVPFKPIDTIYDPSVNDYIHQNAVTINTKWNYFLKLIRYCPSKDSVYSDTMAIDLTNPNVIEIDSVTVKNGRTEIGWKASAAADTKGYVIYYEDISGNIGIIDTVYGIGNNFYRDNVTGNPNIKTEKYRIAPMDSCDNLSVMSREHNTLLVSSAQDTCKEEISLSWNKYTRWPDNQTDYYIYFSTNGGLYTLAHKMQNTNTNHTLTGLADTTSYCFFITAHNRDSNYFSTSNITCITTNFIDKPEYVYLKNVTVNNDQIDISWSIDRISQIREFRVYRKEGTKSFILAQTIPYDNNTDYLISDDTADFNNQRYRYYIEATDVCNNQPIKSNEGGNILLDNKQIENYYQLRWNIYSYWSGGIKQQTIYNKKEEDLSWSYLDNPSNTDDVYRKNLMVSEFKGKEVCFYVENEEGDTNKYGFQEKSVSNITCISGVPIVYIPNAFYPKGVNKFFMPVGKNIDSTKTEITIFNRWGQFVWNSNGITEGWDGRNMNDQEMPGGVYYYHISIVGKDKSKLDFKGDVTLLN
jgi:gliding motility-associated-like protein